jgi:orotidine-5'-phosphate decarboxylase
MSRNFRQLLEAKWAEGKFVCVGLDSDYEKIPIAAKNHSYLEDHILHFVRDIVATTHDLVCAYKPNIAFYEEHGWRGLRALEQVIAHIQKVAPDVPVILDFKRGDIGNTNRGYAKLAFDIFKVDAITIHPYLGEEANQPFLNYKDKGIFVLCRTSNPGAGEFQDLVIEWEDRGNPENGPVWTSHPLYEITARNVTSSWNENHNCGLVVGGTYPEELGKIRQTVGDDMPILIPGIGKQGGSVRQSVLNGCNRAGKGFILNSSSGIIFASYGHDYAEAARRETQKLHDEIHEALVERSTTITA